VCTQKNSKNNTIVNDPAVANADPSQSPVWRLVGRLAVFAMVFVLAFGLWSPLSRAQETVNSYTVVAGDSMSSISQQLDVSVDALAQFNQIEDPSIIRVGQVLLIPSPAEIEAMAAQTLITGPTTIVHALPGDTVRSVAGRTGQELETLLALNSLAENQRLFPGQPIIASGDFIPDPSLRFGAITALEFTDPLVQGRTGMLTVSADRPTFLAASFGDIPLVFTQIDEDPLRQFAYLPVPALLEPGTYTITVSYLAGRGLPVAQSRPVTVVDGGYASQEIVLPDDKTGLLDPAVVIAEEERVNQIWSMVSAEPYWATFVRRPIGSEYPTTSPFGTRRVYIGGENTSYGYHAGQDFAAPDTVPVTAPARGTVVLAEPMAIRGNAVIIDHGRGVLTGYWHLSEMYVDEGEAISPGDSIGLVGTTGRSTGAHLHWELQINSVAVDPMQFLADGDF
jgi:murein DD-endopeptidase MepM/ murein hydrolase activator NlpD